MRLITFLNQYHHFPGFVYEKAQLCPDKGTIEVLVAAAPQLEAGMFGLPSARRRLRSPRPLRIRSVLGFHGAATLSHAAGRLQRLRDAG
jgi:hypothetical protein